MSLQVIRVDSPKPRDPLHRCELGPNISLALAAAKSNGTPAVLFVCEDDAGAFDQCTMLVHVYTRPEKELRPLVIGIDGNRRWSTPLK